jgi:hypothetical protein
MVPYLSLVLSVLAVGVLVALVVMATMVTLVIFRRVVLEDLALHLVVTVVTEATLGKSAIQAASPAAVLEAVA